jgi:hypothetical protein
VSVGLADGLVVFASTQWLWESINSPSIQPQLELLSSNQCHSPHAGFGASYLQQYSLVEPKVHQPTTGYVYAHQYFLFACLSLTKISFTPLQVRVCQLGVHPTTSLSAHPSPWQVQLMNQKDSRPRERCNVFTNTHPLWLSLHIAQRSATTTVTPLYVSVRPYSPMSRECTCHILHLKELMRYAHSDCRFEFPCEFWP